MGRLVALDSSLFVYVFEQHPTFRPPAKLALRRIEQGKDRGIFSMVGLIELLTGAKNQKDPALAELYRSLVKQFPHLALIGLNHEIVEIASDLRAKYGLRTPDAIHLGTAIAAEVDAFLTNDRNLKKVKEIKVELLRSSS